MGYMNYEASRARSAELVRRAEASRRAPARKPRPERAPEPIRLRWRTSSVRSLLRPSRVA